MKIWDWLVSSGIALSVLLFLLWATRQFLTEWITGAVKRSFESDIEKLRSDLRQEERKVEALSSGALTNMSALQAANAERRVNAADALWKAVEDCYQWNWAVVQLSIIDFEKVSERIESDAKLRSFFELTAQNITQDSLALGKGASAERPYIGDLAWALYETYRGVTLNALMKLLMLKQGIDGRQFMNVSGANQMLMKALPEHASRIETVGERAHPEMLQILREKILAEIRKTIEGRIADSESVARANEILGLAAEIRESADRQKVKQPPEV